MLTTRIAGNAGDTALPAAQRAGDGGLSTRRLNVMRLGYAFMGVGLAVVKWPLFVQGVHSLPLMEGVVACLLTGMSLLALLGLRYPVTMLPILLFEVAWKLIWLAAVALPLAFSDGLDAAAGEVLFNCSFVVVIIAVIPWAYTWRRYVTAAGATWR
ncbi:hypothetical protein FE374_03595 [Georgenia yuyongxinii]|uniref:DoxX family protein n=1 Tax=Georgenia yuyongxinii TaxID=2589797 RepID=A0A5B8C164_9MICO|nr:hypothetical protein [Georgenia yuyongxinii]QDC23837.1 hypothetical protein FE374_03595 [Georgenia yuyongxinii]